MPRYQVFYEYNVKLTHCVDVEADSQGDAFQMADELLEAHEEELVTVYKDDWEYCGIIKIEEE